MNKFTSLILLSLLLSSCKEASSQAAGSSDSTPPSQSSPADTKGEKGATGDKGAQGDKGLNGDKGLTGDKGAQGDKGLIGDPGPMGPNGGNAKEFWLAQMNGTLIAQIVMWTGGSNFILWSEAEGVAVPYGYNSNATDLVPMGKGSVTLQYRNADCSDAPHSSTRNLLSMGSMGNLAFAMGGRFFKVGTVLETVTVIAERKDAPDDTLGPCTPIPSYTGPLMQVSEVAIPSMPMAIPFGSYKIIRR